MESVKKVVEQLVNRNNEFIVVKDLIDNPTKIKKYILSRESFVSPIAKEVFLIIENICNKNLTLDLISVNNLIKNEETRNFINNYKIGNAATKISYETIKKFELLRKLKAAGIDTKKFYDEDIDFMKVDEREESFNKLTIKSILDGLLPEEKEKSKVIAAEFSKFISEEKKYFKTFDDTLLEARSRVNALLSQSFEIEGFPLPIIKGKLNSIVAPSHTGKTVYALGLVFTLARAGHKVVFISTEEDIDAVVEKTLEIDENDKAWSNISLRYVDSLNSETMEKMVSRVSEEGYEFLVIDYLKKSMWDHFTSDHVVMEEINSSILRALEHMDSKISVFAFVQANRAAYDEKKGTVEAIQKDPSLVATFIDGGMPVYRSADNLIFLKRDDSGKRHMIICKARRNNELLGKDLVYNVDLVNFDIKFDKDLFTVQKQISYLNNSEVKKNYKGGLKPGGN